MFAFLKLKKTPQKPKMLREECVILQANPLWVSVLGVGGVTALARPWEMLVMKVLWEHLVFVFLRDFADF